MTRRSCGPFPWFLAISYLVHVIIFFPASWLQATLGQYQSAAAARVVRGFLQAHPQYNPPLRGKILQAADDLFRAEKLVK